MRSWIRPVAPALLVAATLGVAFAKLPPSLDRFLNRRTDEFSCADLPPQLELTDRNVRQKAMKYLLLAASLTWRAAGRISWTGLRPLCGLLFGAATLIAYGILRLGMSWWIALAGTAALATSTLQLQNAPALRDYAKAPFALALILLAGWLVKCRPSWRTVPAICAAAGVVLGVGYGFRSDLLIYIPLFLMVIVLFLEGGVRRNAGLKTAGAALFAGAFLVSSWPIVTAISTEGGCEWHVVLLGFSSEFDDELRMQPAPYQVSYEYLDDFMYQSVAGYAARRGLPSRFQPCSREYDAASRGYFMDIAKALPADLIARAYASVRGMWDLPFRSEGPPLPDWFPLLYRARAKALMNLEWIQPAVIFLAVFGLLVCDLRWGAAAAVILLYLGGYPALQSNVRHYFHLEFITWWALGWLASAAIAFAVAARRYGTAPALKRLVPDPRRALLRAAAFSAVLVASLAAALLAARWYQQREMKTMFAAYIAAPKVPLDADHPAPPASLVEVDVDPSACRQQFVAVRYDTHRPGADFSWKLPLPVNGGLTKVFVPVYESFSGVDADGCLQSAARVADTRPFPLLMTAVLAPGWQNQPLYQRIK